MVLRTLSVTCCVLMNTTDRRSTDFHDDIDHKTIYCGLATSRKGWDPLLCATHEPPHALVFFCFFCTPADGSQQPWNDPDLWSRKQVCVCSCLHEHVCICAGVCSPPCLSVWWREAAVPEWRGMPAGSDGAAAAAQKVIGHGRHMRTGREKWRWSRQIERTRGERLMREVPRVERAMAASAC